MQHTVIRPTHVLVGEQSLLIQCCETLLARDHRIVGVVSTQARIVRWCAEHALPCFPGTDALRGLAFDWLLSVTNLKMLPGWLLDLPARGAINFHDGPLPRYAGLNAPVWALINGEREHGITWHLMEAGADTGGILVQRRFAIEPADTAFSLNARCYEAGLDAFGELVAAIDRGPLEPRAQDPAQRSYYGRADSPPAAGVLDWTGDAAALARLVRALDFGPYPNPLTSAKLLLDRRVLCVRTAESAERQHGRAPGTVLAIGAGELEIACARGSLRLTGIGDLRGTPVDTGELATQDGLQAGSVLPALEAAQAAALTQWARANARHDERLRLARRGIEPVDAPFARRTGLPANPAWLGIDGLDAERLLAAFAIVCSRLAGAGQTTLGYVSAAAAEAPAWRAAFVDPVVALPLALDATDSAAAQRVRILAAVAELERCDGAARDLLARDPDLRATPDPATLALRVVRQRNLDREAARPLLEGACLALVIADSGVAHGAWYDASRLAERDAARLLGMLRVVDAELAARPATPLGRLALLDASEEERLRVLSRGPEDGDPQGIAGHCVHQLFEAQVERTPGRDACHFEAERCSYRELNARANRLARHLVALGVGRGEPVGVMVDRSIEMLVALYAVLKAGAAYLPLDPVYPAPRLAFMIEDSGARFVILRARPEALPGSAQAVVLDELADTLAGCEETNPAVAVGPADLAYLIYTSGSTGKPKGVLVEHRNVVNFFIGMDRRIGSGPGTWLAVTSISFDISVLELFWTLARGFTVVLSSDAPRQGARPAAPSRPVDFGLFYWNVADESDIEQPDKYRLLIEGALFADRNGFTAVWNPERHFASFGGLFPNPAVTGAAIAAITRNIAIRAGSCVVPLHSPIRIAEEWAVVDNLCNGRVGLSIAAGWAPPDFAIRPENFANAKQIMFDSADVVRRLWRGERVAFPGPSGEVLVRTLPRPIQKELPVWVTTAGNVETFVQAGRAGFHLLTHLLGQTVEEVATKVQAYRQAWREGGHAGSGTVTLMLHTFVGRDAGRVEEIVRGPLKAYLRSAMNLVKAAAWQFPTFKKMSEEQGKTLDEFFATISAEDLDDLLEFAFQRYFHASGLFGTPEHCLQMVARTVAADVDEIACLIDFGIDTQTVLDHLPVLDELRQLANSRAAAAPAAGDSDFSIPALLARHAVSHFQCTPSMATMLANDSEARAQLGRLRHLMIGGEAFPPELARDLLSLGVPRISNMYGPTETTIWSAMDDVRADTANSVPIGTPLANQRIHILDGNQQQLPAGIAGELAIGGAGVVRGYLHRPELTAERFLPDPFDAAAGARIYRTGDLARVRDDGRIECLGRLDHQVKIRGYRIELGEIEALLRMHPAVREAAVILREDQPGDQRLVAYVRASEGAAAAPGELRDWLRSQLPEFMVPALFVGLAELPLTPNGKIDRKALPVPTADSARPRDLAPPGNAVEQMVAGIWKNALGVEQVGMRENFFDIGGHSLLIVQVLKALRERVERPIQMTDLFRHTTIEAIARFITGADTGPSAASRGKARADARRAAVGRRGG